MTSDSLNLLPAELILELGLFLQSRSLAALACSSKRYAQLLTPQLYTRWLQHKCGEMAHRSTWHYTQYWGSPYAVDYFQKYPSDVSQVHCCATLLHRFAGAGNLCLVRVVLARGADVNAKTRYYEETPLHVAVHHGHAEIVHALMQAGADVNAKDRSLSTPLQTAIRGRHSNVVLCLLKFGPGIFEGRLTALEEVIYHGVLELSELLLRAILDAGIDINMSGTSNHTVLHTASWKGYKSLVQSLLNNGADPFCMVSDGSTALHMACSQGHAKVAKLLIEAMRAAGGDPFLANTAGLTPLDHAITSCQLPVVQLLYDSGADVSVVDEDGITTIQRALDGPRCIFDLILDRGPTVWPSGMLQSRLCRDTRDMARSGRPDQRSLQATARILGLVKAGRAAIDLSVKGVSNSTPLNNVCRISPRRTGTIGIIRSFIAAGSDVDVPDNEGRTPIHNILRSSRQYEDCEVIHLLINSSKDLNKLSNHGDSYLHEAVRYGHPRMAQLLLRKMNRDVLCAVNNTGRTALHYAIELQNIPLVQQILATGIDPDVQNQDGQTALHLASGSSSADLVAVELLVEAGADMSIMDDAGNPPIHYAVVENNREIADFLVKWVAAEHQDCLDCLEYDLQYGRQLREDYEYDLRSFNESDDDLEG